MKKKLVLLASFVVPFFMGSQKVNAQLALDLAGTGNYAQTAYNLNQTAFTVEYDMYIHAHQNFNAGVTFTTGNNPTPVDYYVNNTGQVSSLVGNTAAFSSLTLGPITSGAWHNIAYVYPGGGAGIKVFIDGVQVGTHMGFTFNPVFSNGFFRIGDRMDGVTNANAKYDNVRIWSIARTNAEVNADRTRCFSGLEAGLDILYNMEEGAGTTLFDYASLNGSQDATITGSVTWTAGIADPTFTKSKFVATCFELVSPSGNYTYTSSGVYQDTLSSVAGCDSIIEMNVKIPTEILEQTLTETDPTICVGGSTTIVMNGSESDVNYTLINSGTGAVVDGPISGTGSAINFATGTVNSTSNYIVTAEKNKFNNLTFGGDAATSFVDLGTNLNTEFQGTNQITVESWVYMNSNQDLQTIVGNYEGDMQFLLRVNNFGQIPAFFVSNGTNLYDVNGATILSPNTWYHLAGTYDGTTIKIYVNGILDGQTAVSLNFSSCANPVKIGGGLLNNSEYFDGMIHGVRIWNTTRTDAEILANMDNCLSGTENGLLAMYNMFDGSGSTTLSDETGNGYDGVLTNLNENTAWTNVNMPTISCHICSIDLFETATITTTTLTATASNNSVTLTAIPAGANYQWINCSNNSVIAGATNQTYVATANGNYAVVVDNGTCIDTSNCVTINDAAINEVSTIDLSIAPNPTNGKVSIQFNSTEIASITLMDAQGKLLRQASIQSGETISLENLEKGVYFINLTVYGKTLVKRVVKQ